MKKCTPARADETADRANAAYLHYAAHAVLQDEYRAEGRAIPSRLRTAAHSAEAAFRRAERERNRCALANRGSRPTRVGTKFPDPVVAVSKIKKRIKKRLKLDI